MFENIACATSQKMASYLDWDEIEKAEFYLGMKVLMHNVRTILGIMLLSAWAGLFKESCIVFLAFGLLRIKAGGFHCKESWQCFCVTSLIVIGGAFVAYQLEGIENFQVISVYGVLFGVALLIAPQGTKNRPISFDMKKKRKWETIVLLAVYMLLTIIWKDTVGKFVMVAAILEMVSLVPSVMTNMEIK